MEPIEVNLAACLFRGEVEEHETLSAEIGHIVVHLQGVNDRLPLFAVEAVEESGLVGEASEIMIYTEPYFRLIQRFGFDVLSNSIFLVIGTMHHKLQLSIFLLQVGDTYYCPTKSQNQGLYYP